MEAFGLGKLNKKTLQPRRKRLDVFDMEYFLKDWETNNISDRSFRCKDLTFYDDSPPVQGNSKNVNSCGDENNIDLGDRHGVYLYSSKDWV